ncbi:MAG: nuclear transport factor 2 family protein [Candidatus Udaeobacter sp.]
MKHNSEDEQTLIKIQHEWAEARLKRDSSFPQRIEADDFTVVWFNGTTVSKEEDLKSYESTDTVFTDFKIDDLKVRFYGDMAIVVGQGSIKAHTKTQDLSGKYVWTDTFVKQRGAWTAVASQVTPVVQK